MYRVSWFKYRVSWFMYRVSWFMYTDLVYALVNLQSWCMQSYRVGLCTEMVNGQSWFMY